MKTSFIILSVLVIASLLFWQCQRATYTKANFPEERLSFGSGGGFTGAVTTYHLLPNGQLFKTEDIQADTIPFLSIKKSDAKALFKQVEELKILELDFNHPGNMYNFIGYYTEEGKNQVTWGDHNTPAPSEIIELHKNLHSLVITKE